MPDDVFCTEDLVALGRYVAERWTAGTDADWSAPAGTLEWSCTATADHAVDCVWAPATFLASRRTDRYPDIPIFTAGPDATVQQLVESLEVMCRLVADVVDGAPASVRAVLFAGDEPILGPPADFVPLLGPSSGFSTLTTSVWGSASPTSPTSTSPAACATTLPTGRCGRRCSLARWREPTIPGVIY